MYIYYHLIWFFKIICVCQDSMDSFGRPETAEDSGMDDLSSANPLNDGWETPDEEEGPPANESGSSRPRRKGCFFQNTNVIAFYFVGQNLSETINQFFNKKFI
jgi:hypothetical protein